MRYVNRRDAWMILLILPAILPAGFIYFWGISHAVMYVKAAVLVILFLEYLLRRIPLDNYLALVIAYLVMLLFSTCINGGDYVKYITIFLNVLYPVLWCRLSFEEGRINNIVGKLSVILTLVALFDAILYILVPNGITTTRTGELVTRMGIISNDNSITPYLIAGCVLVLFSNVRQRKDSALKDVIILLLFTFAMYYVFTGVGIIVSLICSFLFFAFKYSNTLRKLLDFKKIIFILSILFITFCVFRVTSWISFLSVVLGSSVTFTGRTNLWEYAMGLIATHPLLGYGVQKDVYMLGYAYRTTPHNMYFQMLIWSGFIGALPFVGIAKRTLRIVSSNWKTRKDIRILSIGVIGVLIYFLFEVHTSVQNFWIVLSYINYYMLFDRTQTDSD